MAEFVPAGPTGRPYHIIWRTAAHRPLFLEDRDRFVYLGLMRAAGARAGVGFLGYALMPDHVHLVAVAELPATLVAALRRAHAAYSRYLRSSHGSAEGRPRCHICPLHAEQVEKTVAYVESNPVRGGLVPEPEKYHWSSAAANLGLSRPYLPLARCAAAPRLGADLWRQALKESCRDYGFWKAIRRQTYAGLAGTVSDGVAAQSELASVQVAFDLGPDQGPTGSLAALAIAVAP